MSARLYHSYCVNFDTALDRLNYWKSFTHAGHGGFDASVLGSSGLNSNHKKRIRKLMKEAKRDNRHAQIDLQSYLLMPIQRIPRYRMLLEALMDATPSLENPTEPETALEEAFESISALATEMNERKRDSEGRKRLVSCPRSAADEKRLAHLPLGMHLVALLAIEAHSLQVATGPTSSNSPQGRGRGTWTIFANCTSYLHLGFGRLWSGLSSVT